MDTDLIQIPQAPCFLLKKNQGFGKLLIITFTLSNALAIMVLFLCLQGTGELLEGRGS